MSIRANIFFVLLYCGFLFSQNTEKPAPSWVSQRPVSSSRFIGIGVAEKNPGSNYIMEAKKNALYDLASEIKVNISSNSMLYSYQNNNQFNQTFNSLIKLSNTENIEGFQMADSYENDKQYWVYYYLDKEEYFRRKEQKKQTAIQQANQWLSSSVQELNAGNYTQALFLRIKAMGLLIPYLNEEIKLDPGQTGGATNLVELTRSIQQQLNIILISPTTSLVLKPLQSSYPEVSLIIKNNSGAKMNFHQMPFKVDFNNEEIRLKKKNCVVNENTLKPEIEKVFKFSGEITLEFIPDLLFLTQNDSIAYSGARLLSQLLSSEKQIINFKIEPLRVNIQYQLSNFSSPLSPDSVSEWTYVINEFFRQPYISIVENPSQTIFQSDKTRSKKSIPQQSVEKKIMPDFTLVVSFNTYLYSGNSVFYENTRNYLAVLKGDFILKNSSGEEIFRFPVSELYGYEKDKYSAGINAYRNFRFPDKIKEALFHIQRKMIQW